MVVGATVYLIQDGIFSGDRFALSEDAWLWLLTCGVLFAVVTAGVAARFHLLLGLLAIRSRYREQVRIVFSGLLLQMIGSSFAFDAMRAVLMRRGGMAGGRIVGTILVDRLLGLSAFVFFGCAGLFLLFEPDRYLPALGAALAAVVLVPTAIVAWPRLIRIKGLGFLGRLPGSGFIAAVGETLLVMCRQPLRLFRVQLFSVLVALSQLFCYYIASKALLSTPLSVSESVVAAAIANLVGVLPLPMTGLGVGESVFGGVVAGMRGEGMAASYAAVFFLVRMVVMLVGVVGWLFIPVRQVFSVSFNADGREVPEAGRRDG